MARPSSSSLLIRAALALAPLLAAANFYQDIDIAWGGGRGKILGHGNLLTLSLDKFSGSRFQSKHDFLFVKVDMQMKLITGNSAGSITTYYLSSQGANHDEIDMEFLGNETGQPYMLHTNVYTQGKGNREQQFRLWFDATFDFHTYSILWNPNRIIFVLDGTPIREFKNMESMGVPFPKNQPMKMYSTLWNANDWATQGGWVKVNWSEAPFIASYRGLNVNSCSCSSCGSNIAWLGQELDATGQEQMKWVQNNYMIYNYCTDMPHLPKGLPRECIMT